MLTLQLCFGPLVQTSSYGTAYQHSSLLLLSANLTDSCSDFSMFTMSLKCKYLFWWWRNVIDILCWKVPPEMHLVKSGETFGIFLADIRTHCLKLSTMDGIRFMAYQVYTCSMSCCVVRNLARHNVCCTLVCLIQWFLTSVRSKPRVTLSESLVFGGSLFHVYFCALKCTSTFWGNRILFFQH